MQGNYEWLLHKKKVSLPITNYCGYQIFVTWSNRSSIFGYLTPMKIYFIRKNNKNENALYITVIYKAMRKCVKNQCCGCVYQFRYFSYRYISFDIHKMYIVTAYGWGLWGELWKNTFCSILCCCVYIYTPYLSTLTIYILEVHLPICQYQYKSK